MKDNFLNVWDKKFCSRPANGLNALCFMYFAVAFQCRAPYPGRHQEITILTERRALYQGYISVMLIGWSLFEVMLLSVFLVVLPKGGALRPSRLGQHTDYE